MIFGENAIGNRYAPIAVFKMGDRKAKLYINKLLAFNMEILHVTQVHDIRSPTSYTYQ